MIMPNLTFSHRDLNGYSPPSCTTSIFARHLNCSTWFIKTVNIPVTKKIFSNGINDFFWEIRQRHFYVCQENSNKFSSETNKLYGVCKNFCFFYLHIGLSPQVFLRRSHLMLLEMYLCVVIFKMCFFNAQSHFTLTALLERFLCHTPVLTYATPQLCLRRDRPMFAAADFKPSDL